MHLGNLISCDLSSPSMKSVVVNTTPGPTLEISPIRFHYLHDIIHTRNINNYYT